jgi:phosphohistidine phosphatase
MAIGVAAPGTFAVITWQGGFQMFLYLVQHAEAKKEEEDPQRGLTDKGFRDIARSALFAQERGVLVTTIFHSGKKRALQTAQTTAKYLKPMRGVTEADGLAPMDNPRTWAARLSNIDEDVMLVGHLPHLARLTSLLLCGDQQKDLVEFEMAGIVCLRRSDDGHWAVEWMVAPEMMR